MGLSCSGELWQNRRWKFFLVSGSKTQGPRSLLALYGGVYSFIPSSGD